MLSLSALLAACNGSGSSGGGETTSIDFPPGSEPPGDAPAFPFATHLEQARVTDGAVHFHELFVIGDELFGARFNALDGAGALTLPDGSPLDRRFSRVPPGGGRFTGPNAQGCEACHNAPFGTSGGDAASNVAQDPAGAGAPPFNHRNTTSLFGAGLLQRLAEEMTEELAAERDGAAASAVPGGAAATVALVAKGISFGTLEVAKDGGGMLTLDASAVEGVSPDLVVRPFGWKGNVPTLREFVRGAARNELGMEADEVVAKLAPVGPDPDGDGVEGELSVGDITALTIYVAAQETPTTVARMASAHRMGPPSPEFDAASQRGEQLFSTIGCTACHVPELRLLDPVFEEPTLRGGGAYADGSIDPVATELDPARPFRFHLGQSGDFPRPEPHPSGGLRVRLFGDLKRHNLGAQLADAQETNTGSATGAPLEIGGSVVTIAAPVFLTAELWGAGSTGPWLHDGRAATLEEAILLHGVDAPPPPGDPARSEAQESREAFATLTAEGRRDVVTFLKSLILFEEKGE